MDMEHGALVSGSIFSHSLFIVPISGFHIEMAGRGEEDSWMRDMACATPGGRLSGPATECRVGIPYSTDLL